MNGEKMQFRSFTFPCNPQSIIIEYGNNLAAYSLPGKGEFTHNSGGKKRKITCKGVFFAASYPAACEYVRAFAATAENRVAGALFVPGMPPVTAHVESFVYEAAGDGSSLPYTIIFREGDV